ncbi:MAG: hypothetical protein HY649_05545 [Acidobacteria bacterium]|nr:hypothetical protein [Acidobacteriota bacterium]
MIQNDLQGTAASSAPFAIGDLDPGKSFVHIFDDTTLDLVMGAVDTISDFTAYLSKKEKFLRSGRHICAAGEEELLAVYLTHLSIAKEHDFEFPSDVSLIVLDEGFWEAFQSHPQRLAQIKENDISYVWDSLIETFNYYALRGEQYHCYPPNLQSTELILRFLARERRTRRRMLGRAIFDLVERTPPRMRATRVVLPSSKGDPYYVFLVFPVSTRHSEEENRTVRGNFLEACCRIVKLRFPDAQHIVGIATEAGVDNEKRSEDAVYIDARTWTEADDAKARQLQRGLGILTNPTAHEGIEREYPDLTH